MAVESDARTYGEQQSNPASASGLFAKHRTSFRTLLGGVSLRLGSSDSENEDKVCTCNVYEYVYR